MAPLPAAGWAPGTAFTGSALPSGGSTGGVIIDHRADRVLGPVQDDAATVEDMDPFPIAREEAGRRSRLSADVRPKKPAFHYGHEDRRRASVGVDRFLATLVGAPVPSSATAATAIPTPRRQAARKPPSATPATTPAEGGYAASRLLAGMKDAQRKACLPASLCRKARTSAFAVWWVEDGCAHGAKGHEAYRLERLQDSGKVIAAIRNQPDDWPGQPEPLMARWPADAHVRLVEDSARCRWDLCNDALSSRDGMPVSAWLRAHLEPPLAGQAEFLPVAIRSENGRAILHRDVFSVHPSIAIDALDPVAARAHLQTDGRINLSRTRPLAIDPATVPTGTRIIRLARHSHRLMIVSRSIIPALLALPVRGMLLLPPEACRLDRVMDWSRPR